MRARALWLLPAVLAGAAALALAIGRSEGPRRAEPGETARSVSVIELAPRPLLPRAVGYGTVEPGRTWRAVPQVAGRVSEIHPELVRGGTVAEGDLLIRIAPETYRAAVAQAEANLAATRAEIAELEATRAATEKSLEIEREALALYRTELERQRRLARQGTVAQSVADAQERTVLQQRAKVQDLENQLSTIPARLDALRQQVRVSEANLEIAELDLGRTGIRAPFDARVASADVQIQQFVGAGAAVAVLDGVARAEIDAQIPPGQMAQFVRLAAGERAAGPADFATVASRIELSAEVSLAGRPVRARWPAEVVRISDTVDPATRSVGVIVAVPDPYGAVVPGERPPLIKGMFARVELRAPPVEGRFLVPRSALREGRLMIADAEDRLAFVEVDVVYTVDDIAAVEGVEPGMRVVTSDPTPAIAGMLLRPHPDEALAARISRAAMPERAGP